MYQIHCDFLQIHIETQTVSEISQFLITNNVDHYFDEDMTELLKNWNFEDLLHIFFMATHLIFVKFGTVSINSWLIQIRVLIWKVWYQNEEWTFDEYCKIDFETGEINVGHLCKFGLKKRILNCVHYGVQSI